MPFYMLKNADEFTSRHFSCMLSGIKKNKSEVKVAAIDAVKRQYEEKFKALEKAKADALEMAAQEDA